MFDFNRRNTAKTRTLLANLNPDLTSPLIESRKFDRLRSAEIYKTTAFNRHHSYSNINTEVVVNKINIPIDNNNYVEEPSISWGQSVILFVIIVIISSLQWSLYRYTLNNTIPYFNHNYTTTTQKFSNFFLTLNFELDFGELVFFCWRIQSIFLFLLVYLFASKIFKFNFRFFPKFSKFVDKENLALDDVISFENLKFSSVNLISTFILLYSTKYLPLGIITYFNSFDLYSILKFDKNIANFKFLPCGISYLGMITLSYFIIENSLNPDLSLKGMQMISCIFLCFISIYLSKFYFRPIFEEKIKRNIDPLNIVFSLYTNNLIISVLFFNLIQISAGVFDFSRLIGWLFDYTLIMNVGFIIGFFGFLFILSTHASTTYLNADFIRASKYAEIPLIDLLGSIVFGLYNVFSLMFCYVLVVVLLMFGGFVKEFVIDDKKDNSKKKI